MDRNQSKRKFSEMSHTLIEFFRIQLDFEIPHHLLILLIVSVLNQHAL
jgi:hypothetical protein